VLVGASGTESQAWTAASDESWIWVSPTSGSTPGTITVQLDPNLLIMGLYQGQVNVQNEISSVTLPVYVVVSDEIFRSYLPIMSGR
jgi:hypothetical protein